MTLTMNFVQLVLDAMDIVKELLESSTIHGVFHISTAKVAAKMCLKG